MEAASKASTVWKPRKRRFSTGGARTALRIALSGLFAACALAGCSGSAPPFDVTLITQGVNTIAVADFDGDDNPDVAVGIDGVYSMSLLFGDGQGGFGRTGSIERHQDTSVEAAADFNADGHPDLALSTTSGFTTGPVPIPPPQNKIVVYVNDGTGTFQLFASADGVLGKRLVVDLDADGYADLVGVEAGRIHVFMNNHSGGFVAEPEIDGPFDESLGVGDLNSDGFPDLFVAGTTRDSPASVFLGDGHGGFSAAVSVALPGPCSADSPLLADFNGDGRLDAYLHCQPQRAPAPHVPAPPADPSYLLLGDGLGGFAQQTPMKPQSWIGAADFNGDGHTDAIVDQGYQNQLGVVLGSAAGLFSEVHAVTVVVVSPVSIGIADFNRDGKPDIVTNGGYLLLNRL
jgi:hypothetical protein